jgi:hypothetical protein
MAQDLARIGKLLTELGISDYASVKDVEGVNSFEILPSSYETILALDKTGKEDTLKYVDHVKKFLDKLRTKDTSYNSYYDQNTLLIGSITNLINFQKKLATSDFLSSLDKSAEGINQLENSDYNKAVLFPYFYSMYLYTPILSDKEIESGISIDPSYDRGMWYAPSVGEMSLAIYCRGLSVSSAFSSATIKDPINTKAASDLAIFTKAYNRMGSDFPAPWSDLLSLGDNIVTNIHSTDTDNYAYLIYEPYNGIPQGSWKQGTPPYDVTGDYSTWWEWHNDEIWRMNKHYGIPFTQYSYAKPNN